MAELTKQEVEAVKAIQRDWVDNVRALVITANQMLGTSFLIERTDMEVLLVIYDDLQELTAAIADVANRRNGEDIDLPRLKELSEGSIKIREYASEKFNSRFRTGHTLPPEEPEPELPGMYL